MKSISILGYSLLLGYVFSNTNDCPPVCQCGLEKGKLKWTCGGNNITTDQLNTFWTYGDPKSVEILALRKNNITTFPLDHFTNFTNLKNLDLGENQLTSVPKNISLYLPKLSVIKLNGNNLVALTSEDFNGYENIVELDIFQNKITELPENVFSQLKSVKKIYIEKNQISKISVNALKGLKDLEELSLQANMLTEIPFGVFNDTRKLKSLWLSKNPFKSLQAGLFSSLTNLQDLYIKEAGLTDYKIEAGAFAGAGLSRNGLDRFDLKNNNLTTLRLDWFDNKSAPYDTYLDGNPVNCDCFLYETYQAFTKVQDIAIDGICKAPRSVTGKSITTDVLSKNAVGCTACSTNKCQNNATCNLTGASSYECKCSVYYYGKFCEYDDLCIHNPCLNNATCRNYNSSHFTCNCTDGYFGNVCEKEKPCYFVNPCQNNGTCIVAGYDYFCNCTDGYHGKDCEKVVMEAKGTRLHFGWIILIILCVLTLIIIVSVLVYKCKKQSQPTDSTDGESAPLKVNV